jgi:hypothetical protein
VGPAEIEESRRPDQPPQGICWPEPRSPVRDAAGVHNNGVQDDTLTGATYIAFCDPDGIAWELYATPVPSDTENSMGGMS